MPFEKYTPESAGIDEVIHIFNCCRPLGPFVPAPPEVARQILREQGGPSPYDGSGRRMHAGANNGGPTPILAVPPAFRQDPRRMRR